MPSKDLGTVSFALRGEWQEKTTYQRLNVVSSDGSAYCAKIKNKGERPAPESNYWQLLAARGAQGQKGDKGTGLRILGTYADLSALTAAVTAPAQGDMFNVGAAPPYIVYMYDNGVWVSQGKLQGTDGADGITPSIGDNGNWYLGNTDTGKPSRGEKGADGTDGANGITPSIGDNGNWYLGDTDTGKPSRGAKGDKGDTGKGLDVLGTYADLSALTAAVTAPAQGDIYNVGATAPYTLYMWDVTTPPSSWLSLGKLQGPTGADGAAGADGITPTIGDNGNWYLGDTDTGKPSRGEKGADGTDGANGITPSIGDNGNWYLGDTDTGKPSRGAKGDKGDTGPAGYTPVRGTDYWTAADKAEIVSETLAALPTWTGGSY